MSSTGSSQVRHPPNVFNTFPSRHAHRGVDQPIPRRSFSVAEPPVQQYQQPTATSESSSVDTAAEEREKRLQFLRQQDSHLTALLKERNVEEEPRQVPQSVFNSRRHAPRPQLNIPVHSPAFFPPPSPETPILHVPGRYSPEEQVAPPTPIASPPCIGMRFIEPTSPGFTMQRREHITKPQGQHQGPEKSPHVQYPEPPLTSARYFNARSHHVPQSFQPQIPILHGHDQPQHLAEDRDLRKARHELLKSQVLFQSVAKKTLEMTREQNFQNTNAVEIAENVVASLKDALMGLGQLVADLRAQNAETERRVNVLQAMSGEMAEYVSKVGRADGNNPRSGRTV